MSISVTSVAETPSAAIRAPAASATVGVPLFRPQVLSQIPRPGRGLPANLECRLSRMRPSSLTLSRQQLHATFHGEIQEQLKEETRQRADKARQQCHRSRHITTIVRHRGRQPRQFLRVPQRSLEVWLQRLLGLLHRFDLSRHCSQILRSNGFAARRFHGQLHP